MTDYIKREDAICIARLQGKNAQFDGMVQDVAPVRHGKWIDKSGGIEGAWNYCSVCGERAIELFDYCPNCGAKMDEGEP